MKTIKQIDFYSNLVVFVTLTPWVLIDQSVLPVACLITICGQLTSILFHSVKGWFTQKKTIRRSFQHFWSSLVFIFSIALALSQSPYLQMIQQALYILVPTFAIIYLAICNRELRELKMNESLSMR